ncbi:MAG: beta-ketoacyl synthase N-terminal-like domain-containing protein [Pseudomonadota bacterium]
MQHKRVVVTGMGLRSPIGNSLGEFSASLRSGRSGIRIMHEWDEVAELRTRLGGVCEIGEEEAQIHRKYRRSMGRVAVLATLAAKDALEQSGLAESAVASPACGVSFGSTAGSTGAQVSYQAHMFNTKSMKGVPASAYLQCMSHTCAANIAVFFHTRGPFIASCTACVSGSQGVGFGYEAIRQGRADIMISGGADEMHFMNAGIFDLMMATSSGYNDRPDLSPRPFDAERDGLVVSEGAGCLVLEEYERAKARGAEILAEILGYWTNGSGVHLTQSDAASMEECMRAALKDAGVSAERVEHINAHATATDNGDEAEALASHRVFGDQVPTSALKGQLGHTLGASGALETIATIIMAREGFMAATRNLHRPDPKLAPLDHIRGEPRDAKFRIGINNNFAFGGINTSLVISLL